MSGFIRKTNDVYCDPELLQTLQAADFLRVSGYNLLDYLSCDIEQLHRRSLVFNDTLSIHGLRELLSDTVDRLKYVRQMLKLQSDHTDNERGLYSVKQLEQYFEIIDSIFAFWSEHKDEFKSPDYTDLFEKVAELAEDDGYAYLKKGTKELLDSIAAVKSVSVGFNLNAALAPYESGILSVNDRYVQSGKLVDKLMRLDGGRDGNIDAICPLVLSEKQCAKGEADALNFAMYSALNKIFKRQIRSWESEICNHLESNLSFMLELLPDFQFVVGAVSVHRKMRNLGLRLCTPEYRPMEEKCFSASGLYNPVLGLSLAESCGAKPVKNDIVFDKEGMIYILTGPNNGGKSVFLCAVCLAQIMAQLGMPVAAERFTVSPVSSILVDFPKYRSLHERGRLAEECADIRKLFSHTNEYSLCLFDEAFSSTDGAGAVALSQEVLRAMSYIGAKGIYNTHLHELTGMTDELNGEAGENGSKIDLLCAGIGEGEVRTYKISRGFGASDSYARTIANQYGIDFEHLTKRDKN